MKKGTIRPIPLQADLCLNKQKVDIEDFKGWNKCNAPVYGNCLSPLYKKNGDHHDIYIGDDYYDWTNGVLSKNGAEVLSGVPTETDIAGSVYTILRHENGMLVYTKKHADANATAMGYVLQDAKTEVGVNNEAKAVKVCSDTTNFNAGAIVLGVDENGNSLGYIYIDSTEGLLKVVNGEFTRISNLKSGSLFFVKDNLLYYGAGTKLCSVDITKTNQGDKDVTVITETYYSTNWYLPEFVGDKVFYGDKTDELYYVYYADITAEEIEGKFVGQYNQEAKDKIAEKEAEEALKNSVEPSTTVSAS